MLPSLMSSSSSPASVRVEKATSHLLIAPDWTMNMDICDSINTDPLLAKDVVKAVKKRLQNKNPRVQFLALTLLETMIKNCGDFVHFQVVDREVLHDMVKLVRKATDVQVRDKILVLLDSWHEAFGGPGGKYPQYYHAYSELKTSGIMFPQHQKDAALIYTPVSQTFHSQVGNAMPSSSVQRQDEVMISGMGNMGLSDLNNIRSVMELFVDMLMAVNPENPEAIRDEVIADLASQCRINQKKVMHLINSTEKEELLEEALVLNDNLQYALARHDAIASGSPLPLEPPHAFPNTSSVVPTPSPPALARPQFDDQEVEDEERNRDAKLKSSGDQLVSPNRSDITTATSPSGASEASSSVASNALVLLDPPTPVSAPRKEDDMIDFLGLVLSTNAPPQTPPASVPPSNHSQNPFYSPSLQQVGPRPPQGYAAQDSYVAPWAQPAVAPLPAPPPPIPTQQPVAQYPYNYQTSPWNPSPSPGVSSNPFLSNSSVQFPAFPPSPPPPPPPPPPPIRHFQYPVYQSNTSVPAPSLAPFQPPAPAAPQPIQYSKAIQNYNSLGSGQAQPNANNSKQAGSSRTTTKAYVMPDKLFDDLIELRNPDGSLKSKNASTLLGASGQGMARERK